MAMRLGQLAELLPNLPCKQEVNGKKLLLTCEEGEIIVKEVILGAAWQLKLEGLLKLKTDASIFKVWKTEMREEMVHGGARGVVWMTDEVVPVVRVAAPEKKLSNSGFGLGHHFKNLADTRNHHPSVPEPWGGFEPIQPMLPCGGIEHTRIYGQTNGVPQVASQMKQCTLHEAFKIQPMEF